MIQLTKNQAIVIKQLLWDTIQQLEKHKAKSRVKELKAIRKAIDNQLTKTYYEA